MPRLCRRRPVLVAGLLAPAALVAVSFALPAADDCIQRTDLAANDVGGAPNVDAKLRNPWGVSFAPGGGGFIWVADNHTGYATQYDAAGVPQSPTITIPPASGSGPGSPTGVVANATQDFEELGAVPARVLFSTEDGLIVAWQQSIDGTTARVVADRSAAGAKYKGLAIANDGTSNFLYAADFHNGRVDVFDAGFNVAPSPGGFQDRTVPKGFAPFNVANVGGVLYVTYAKQDAGREDEVAGHGLGVVNVFDANGFRLRRFVARGHMDAPWAVTLAPAAFGTFARRILVGNFGDGTIQTFDVESGRYRGALRDANGRVLSIDGLWGLAFESSGTSLFFAAGPNDEADGVLGKLTAGNCAHGR